MARSFALLVLSLSVVGCSNMPTSPSALPTGIGSTGAAPVLADPSLNGSAYQLVSVASDSMTFFNNTNGDSTNPVTAPWDASTTFRRAQIDRYVPNDPCKTIAESYSNVLTSDGFLAALQSFAINSCGARIIVQYGLPTDPVIPTDPLLPPSPIRILSFQPIPGA